MAWSGLWDLVPARNKGEARRAIACPPVAPEVRQPVSARLWRDGQAIWLSQCTDCMFFGNAEIMCPDSPLDRLPADMRRRG